MTETPPHPGLLPVWRKPLGWVLLYLIFVAGIFTFPLFPAGDLDPSWRIALGYFFEQGKQFGREVVFTYGPLGFAMGKTYSGVQYAELIIAQLAIAVVFAGVILWQGAKLQGLSRWAYFVYFLLFGVTYEDALHMLVIVILGFELLRRSGGPWRWSTLWITGLLGVLSIVKFTDFMLAAFVIGIATMLGLWRGRQREALALAGSFAGAIVFSWLLCGQHVANLPAYFIGSWSISMGYTATMGLPGPWAPFWKALVVLGVIATYLAVHLAITRDKARSLANAAMLAGFVFMNWKHGFVRADGHMIGFFFCALLPLTAYPALLDDEPRLPRLHYAAFLAAGFLSLWGIENALHGVVRGATGIIPARIWPNVEQALEPKATRQMYDDRLSVQKNAFALPAVRKVIGQSTVDVFGFHQSVAIFNGFNYRPRPVIQSYSAYTPYLAALNRDFLLSPQAPEYVLMRIETIDDRPPMIDDPHMWRLLPHLYDYVQQEKGFQLWKLIPRPVDPAAIDPKPLRATDLAFGQTLSLADLSDRQLWTRITIEPTLIGRLIGFLYKPPRVNMTVVDPAGVKSEFQLPLPMARSGFILSPVIEDTGAFAGFANGKPGRTASKITLNVRPKDRFFYRPVVRVELFDLKPAGTADRFFSEPNARLFGAFKSIPLTYYAFVPVSEPGLEGRTMVVLHAPSEMMFALPDGATSLTGGFGFIPAAFAEGTNTNGAEFVIYWANDAERRELFKQFLNPRTEPADRGLRHFKIDLTGLPPGHLYLRIDAGPSNNNAWDWTGWTDIEIK